MPYFLCKLAAENGRIFSQSFLAPSLSVCRKHFESEGLCVLSVKRDWKKIRISFNPFEKKINDKDFIMFNQELVAMIKAGYPILKSIEVISGRVKNIELKELLTLVENEVRGGKPLSEAFAPYDRFFSKIYTASLLAGESSGNLAGTLKRYIDYSQVISRTKRKIRSALAYPTLLLIFSFFLFGIIINFILPRFSTFYADFEAQLPFITRALMSFSLVVRGNLHYIPDHTRSYEA
jgi:type IV pilus assembly protein PilC